MTDKHVGLKIGGLGLFAIYCPFKKLRYPVRKQAPERCARCGKVLLPQARKIDFTSAVDFWLKISEA